MASGPSPQQRSDPSFAREIVETVFEGTPGGAERSYRKFLTASVEYLSQHHPDRWGVTLLGRGVRLNAGWVEWPIAAQPQQNRDGALTLWYRTPAKEWTEALPVGNGVLGAMVFGSVEHERLHSNLNQGEFLLGITF